MYMYMYMYMYKYMYMYMYIKSSILFFSFGKRDLQIFREVLSLSHNSSTKIKCTKVYKFTLKKFKKHFNNGKNCLHLFPC